MSQNFHCETDSKLVVCTMNRHLCRQTCSLAQGGSANESSHAGLSCDFSRSFSVILYSALLFLASGWSGPTKGAGSTQSPLDQQIEIHSLIAYWLHQLAVLSLNVRCASDAAFIAGPSFSSILRCWVQYSPAVTRPPM